MSVHFKRVHYEGSKMLNFQKDFEWQICHLFIDTPKAGTLSEREYRREYNLPPINKDS